MEEHRQSAGAVVLGFFLPSDASVLCAADHDVEHRRRFDFPEDFVPSLRHSENVITQWEQERLIGKRFTFAVRESGTGDLLGGCELLPIGENVANLSYWTYPAHRGNGIATRAVALVCALAFDEMRFRKLEVITEFDNIGSRRVAVRNGFKEAGECEGRILHTLEMNPHSDV